MVTVLIGVFDKSTGLPVMGVINQVRKDKYLQSTYFGLVWFIRSHCQEITLHTQNAGYERLVQHSFRDERRAECRSMRQLDRDTFPG